MDTDEGNYHAIPQTRGKNAHSIVDDKKVSHNNNIIEALPVLSKTLGVYGKIDVYNSDTKTLVERKYQLKRIYKGQIYQLWAQYFCLIEMGVEIVNLVFYEISTRKTFQIKLPSEQEKTELVSFLESYRNYNPNNTITANPNKCFHCIYSNLCDKTNKDNVYT